MYNDWVYAFQNCTQKQKVSKLKPSRKKWKVSLCYILSPRVTWTRVRLYFRKE